MGHLIFLRSYCSRPYTTTALFVPMRTLPFTMVGGADFVFDPKESRFSVVSAFAPVRELLYW